MQKILISSGVVAVLAVQDSTPEIYNESQYTDITGTNGQEPVFFTVPINATNGTDISSFIDTVTLRYYWFDTDTYSPPSVCCPNDYNKTVCKDMTYSFANFPVYKRIKPGNNYENDVRFGAGGKESAQFIFQDQFAILFTQKFEQCKKTDESPWYSIKGHMEKAYNRWKHRGDHEDDFCVDFDGYEDNHQPVCEIRGLLPNLAYLSVQRTYKDGRGISEESLQGEKQGQLDTHDANGNPLPNPWIKGNPTMNTYEPSQSTAAKYIYPGNDLNTLSWVNRDPLQVTTDQELQTCNKFENHPDDSPLIRLPENLSTLVQADGSTGTGCTSGYLFAMAPWNSVAITFRAPHELTNSFHYGFVRMPVMNIVNNLGDNGVAQGFMDESNPEGWAMAYHSVTISDGLESIGNREPYTVNNYMLTNSTGFPKRAGDGYGYVLYAPRSVLRPIYNGCLAGVDLSSHGIVCPRGVMEPPMIEVDIFPEQEDGKILAYLLQAPTLGFVFRYKDQSESWPGNTAQTPCSQKMRWLTSDDAATCDQMNGWKPTVMRCTTCLTQEDPTEEAFFSNADEEVGEELFEYAMSIDFGPISVNSTLSGNKVASDRLERVRLTRALERLGPLRDYLIEKYKE